MFLLPLARGVAFRRNVRRLRVRPQLFLLLLLLLLMCTKVVEASLADTHGFKEAKAEYLDLKIAASGIENTDRLNKS